VYLGPPISPQSGIFSQMRRLEQTPLRLSIKADSLMWATMKRFGSSPYLARPRSADLSRSSFNGTSHSFYRSISLYSSTSNNFSDSHATEDSSTDEGIFLVCGSIYTDSILRLWFANQFILFVFGNLNFREVNSLQARFRIARYYLCIEHNLWNIMYV